MADEGGDIVITGGIEECFKVGDSVWNAVLKYDFKAATTELQYLANRFKGSPSLIAMFINTPRLNIPSIVLPPELSYMLWPSNSATLLDHALFSVYANVPEKSISEIEESSDRFVD